MISRILNELINEMTSGILNELLITLVGLSLLLSFIVFIFGLVFIISWFYRLDDNTSYEASFEKAAGLVLLVVFFWMIPFYLVALAMTKGVTYIVKKLKKGRPNDENT